MRKTWLERKKNEKTFLEGNEKTGLEGNEKTVLEGNERKPVCKERK